jgi:excisionase family DNA binding protein
MLALLDQTEGPFIADDAEAVIAKTAAERLQVVARSGHDIQVTVCDGAKIVVPLPGRAVALIQRILEIMGEQKPFSMIPYDAEFTTQNAADFLNISRPFFVGLLDKGEIPHRKVGRHRRVRFSDLIEFQKKTQKRQADALARLAEEEHRLGLD